MFAFLAADPAVVRAEGRVPARWKLALDSDGKARLFLDAASCQMTLGGRTRTVVFTDLAAQLDSASLPSPERKRSTSNVEGKPNDYYLLAWNADDQDFVTWMQTATGLGDIARLVPGLTFQLAAGGAERQFAFGAPEPNQSPFQLTATVLRPVIPVYPITINFWRETPVGSVMLETSHDLPYLFGFFKQWTLKTAPTSPLGRMIGGGEQVRTCAATALPAPLIGQGGTDPGCLGVNEPNGRWTFRKDLPPGGGAGAAATRCASRRRLRINLPRTWRTAAVRLGGRPLRATRRGGRLTAIVDLRGRPAGTVRLRAIGRTATGRRVAQTRTYRLCARRRHGPESPPAPPAPSHSDIWTQCARYAMQGVNTDACAKDVEAGMDASAKYRDVNQAMADGFVKLTDCESSPLGGMGEHWGRLDRMVDPALDVRAPEMLLYLNTPHGRELLGFEYEQTATFGGLPAWGPTHPDSPVSARPSMLGGKVFDGPMAGHTAVQPWHYDLHVYEWVKNPTGLFEPWNPAVKC